MIHISVIIETILDVIQALGYSAALHVQWLIKDTRPPYVQEKPRVTT